MATAENAKKKYTYNDYLKIPDDLRYQLIEGQLIMMTPAPTTVHQKILREIGFILKKYTSEHNNGEIFYAPCDVVLDNENVLQPDIIFISKEKIHLITKKNIQGAPDLVIEIISENTAYYDMIQKKQLYAKFGIIEYWIVIPEECSIELYTLIESRYELRTKYQKNDNLTSTFFPSLEIPLHQIF